VPAVLVISSKVYFKETAVATGKNGRDRIHYFPPVLRTYGFVRSNTHAREVVSHSGPEDPKDD
jgi:hypothetical protein